MAAYSDSLFIAPGIDPAAPTPTLPAVKTKGIGERVMTYILAGSAMYGGYPGGWSSNRWEQVRHFRFWTYIAVLCRMVELAKHQPQVGYVSSGDAPKGFQARKLRQKRWEKSLHTIRPHESVEMEGPEADALRHLLDCPNAWDIAGWADIVAEAEMYLCLTGNGYPWVIPNGWGQPCQMFILPSHWISARFDKRAPTGVDHYDVIPYPGAAYVSIPEDEVIHLAGGPNKNPLHKIDGYAATSATAEWEDASESVQRARFWQMRNQGAPLGAVELPEDYHDPDDADLERIYGKIFSRLQGESNFGRPIVLPPGVTYKPLKITPAEMDFIQTTDQLRDMILAAYGVPKEIAGVQDAGSEIALYGPMKQFCERVIGPRLEYFSHVFTKCLAKRFHPDLRVWFDDPTSESPDQRNKDIDLQMRYGLKTPNEARADFGLEPYAHGGDDPFVPQGLTVVPMNTGEDTSWLDDLTSGGNPGPKDEDAAREEVPEQAGGKTGYGRPCDPGERSDQTGCQTADKGLQKIGKEFLGGLLGAWKPPKRVKRSRDRRLERQIEALASVVKELAARPSAPVLPQVVVEGGKQLPTTTEFIFEGGDAVSGRIVGFRKNVVEEGSVKRTEDGRMAGLEHANGNHP